MDELIINMYGQGLVDISIITNKISSFDEDNKKNYLINLLDMIIQSKPQVDDIEKSIQNSKLKVTFTPCVLLRKGIEQHQLQKIIDLPSSEMDKSLVLLLNLFKVSYERRFLSEKNDPQKWWYWDLSDENNIKKVLMK